MSISSQPWISRFIGGRDRLDVLEWQRLRPRPSWRSNSPTRGPGGAEARGGDSTGDEQSLGRAADRIQRGGLEAVGGEASMPKPAGARAALRSAYRNFEWRDFTQSFWIPTSWWRGSLFPNKRCEESNGFEHLQPSLVELDLSSSSLVTDKAITFGFMFWTQKEPSVFGWCRMGPSHVSLLWRYAGWQKKTGFDEIYVEPAEILAKEYLSEPSLHEMLVLPVMYTMRGVTIFAPALSLLSLLDGTDHMFDCRLCTVVNYSGSQTIISVDSNLV